MNLNSIFMPNRLLSLGISGRDEYGGETIQFHPSRLENIEHGRLWIAAPQERGELVPVSLGENIQVYIISKNEIYAFDGEIKDRIKRGTMAYLLLDLPQSVVRMQRRDFVRIDISIPVILRKGPESWKGMTRNVSGGGMLVNFLEKKPPPGMGEEVVCTLEFNEETLMVKGIVLREDDPNTRAFQFSEIMENDREKIIKFIFRKQIELKRKGLLKR